MGRYTLNTDTDAQVLKPDVLARLQQRIDQLVPPLRDFTVTRRIVLRPEIVGGPPQFEDMKLHIRAASAPDALRMADEAKAARDYR